jgi:hypothetical protein
MFIFRNMRKNNKYTRWEKLTISYSAGRQQQPLCLRFVEYNDYECKIKKTDV